MPTLEVGDNVNFHETCIFNHCMTEDVLSFQLHILGQGRPIVQEMVNGHHQMGC